MSSVKIQIFLTRVKRNCACCTLPGVMRAGPYHEIPACKALFLAGHREGAQSFFIKKFFWIVFWDFFNRDGPQLGHNYRRAKVLNSGHAAPTSEPANPAGPNPRLSSGTALTEPTVSLTEKSPE